ncbi:MAG: hypothetical protein BWZ10_00771 [candidate division BRC1 bacterium ADurb.BinA364]|nr:MAG: hypothetical protein BWZ10_00771 [candidate division BRC1 bacterium ADurb.BinA364]
MKSHAEPQAFEQHLARTRRLQALHGFGGVAGRRESGLLGQPQGDAAGGGARRREDERLFAAVFGQMERQRQHGLLAILLGAGLEDARRGQPLLAFLARIEAAIAEEPRRAIQRAFAQFHGAFAADQRFASEPVRQPVLLRNHRRKAKEAGPARRPANFGQQQVQALAAPRLAQGLDFVDDHDADLAEDFRARDHVGAHLFIDGDQQIEPALEDGAVGLGALARGDGGAEPERRVALGEFAAFFLGQGFGRDQIDGSTPAFEVIQRADFGQEGFTRAGRSQGEQIGGQVGEAFAQGLDLEGEQGIAAFLAPAGDQGVGESFFA